MELEAQLTRLVDEAAVGRLLVTYAAALDGRDWERLATCFADDAVVTYLGGGPLRGRDAVVAHCRQALARYTTTHHAISNIEVRPAGDEARASCYVQAEHRVVDDGDERRWVLGGVYEDRLVRVDDRWEIVERELVRRWEITEDVPRG